MCRHRTMLTGRVLMPLLPVGSLALVHELAHFRLFRILSRAGCEGQLEFFEVVPRSLKADV